MTKKITLSDMKRPKGFAAISPERRREIARMGGKAVAPEKRSFAANPDLASSAGKKGASAPRKPRA